MSRSTPEEITPIELHMSIFYYLLSDVYDENRLLPLKVHSFQGQRGARKSLGNTRVYSSVAVAALSSSNQTVSSPSIVSVKRAKRKYDQDRMRVCDKAAAPEHEMRI